MGIKGLSSFLKDYGTLIDLSKFSNKTICIDISIYLYKFKYNSNTDAFLRKFNYQLNTFEKLNIKPIYIFDGQAPIEKKELQIKRSEKNVKSTNPIKITKEDKTKLKDLFAERHIPFYTAPSEAEKMCSYLTYTYPDVSCMTNDMDALLYGCKELIVSTPKGYILYELNDILTKLEITLEDLIQIGIASGSDYYPAGIYKFGPKKSLDKLKKEGHIKNWTKVTVPEALDITRIHSIFTDFTEEKTLEIQELSQELTHEPIVKTLESVDSDDN
jgi:5'-3' exonuclease